MSPLSHRDRRHWIVLNSTNCRYAANYLPVCSFATGLHCRQLLLATTQSPAGLLRCRRQIPHAKLWYFEFSIDFGSIQQISVFITTLWCTSETVAYSLYDQSVKQLFNPADMVSSLYAAADWTTLPLLKVQTMKTDWHNITFSKCAHPCQVDGHLPCYCLYVHGLWSMDCVTPTLSLSINYGIL